MRSNRSESWSGCQGWPLGGRTGTRWRPFGSVGELPAGAHGQVGAQDRRGVLVDGEDPIAGLGFHLFDDRFVGHGGALLPDGDRAGVEVDVAVAQPAGFARRSPHTVIRLYNA